VFVHRISRAAVFTVAFALAAGTVVTVAEAAKSKRREEAAKEQPKPLTADGPLLTLISLNQQRLFVYDANGFVTTSRVSTGMAGYDTPKGIYSILEKNEVHASNIYEGASMPFMQRLLMTGIAMHAGVVPGYPASHGCIRLPHDFARKFFGITDLGQRVVVTPDVQAPVDIEHPLLFAALPSVASNETTGNSAIRLGQNIAGSLVGLTYAQAAVDPTGRTVESAAQDRIAERERLVQAVTAAGERRKSADGGVDQANKAVIAARDAAKAARAKAANLQRAANKADDKKDGLAKTLKSILAKISKEGSKMRADKLEDLRSQEAAERANIAPVTEEAEKADAAAKAAAADAKAADKVVADALQAVKDAKAEIKASADAEKVAKDAVVLFDRQQANFSLPVSVLISSKTGLISVRQGFERVFEAKVDIENPSVPLDSYVFTAVAWKDATKTDLKWTATNVVEYSSTSSISGVDGELDSPKKKKKGEVREEVRLPPVSDAGKAARTLDRIKIPKDVQDRLAEVVKPGSTLIVSSYDMARSETRYSGTDFVVQMPEVVAKISRPKPKIRQDDFDDDDDGYFFFGGSPKAPTYGKKKSNGPKSFFW
jgi:hypothetical protein